MFENTFFDFATISAVVAAFVSVVGNAFDVPTKYRALIAIIAGVILVALPSWLMEKTIMALLIGLTASGVYSQVKKREYPPKEANTNRTVEKFPPINGPDDV